MPTPELLGQVVPDLSFALDSIDAEAAKRATSRADGVAALSGGAIQPTPDQLAALKAAAAAELAAELRTQLQDVAHVFVVGLSPIAVTTSA